MPKLAIGEPGGRGNAPLLILGPSLGTSALLWDECAAQLHADFRAAAWDLPGHGASPAATASFTVAELAHGVLRAADALGEASFFYAGDSLGGAVGLELALAAPDRVLGAAILCSGAKIGTPEGWTERARMARSEGTASLVVPSAGRWFAPHSIERRPELSGRLLHSLRDADDESYALCAEALASYDVRGRLAEISPRILAVWGEYDEVTPRALAEEIASGVARGSAIGVEQAAHLAPAEQPQVVAQLLTAFFRGAA